MLRKRIFKNLRLIILITLGLFLGILVGGSYYLNQSGGNSQWRDKIAHELENLGIIADFESLRYSPTRGLIAEGVRIYTDESRTETMATLQHLVIDVDKTKLMRGKIRVNNVSLSNAEISMPLDPDEPDGPRIIINDLRGDMFLPDKNSIEAHDVSGVIAGIKLTLDAHIWSSNLGSVKDQPKSHKDARITRIKIVAKIIEEISRWSWPQGKPPHIRIYAEGNIDNPDSAHLEFSLTADELERDDVILHDIEIRGDYNNKIVTLDRISLDDGSGKLEGRADFQPSTRQGRFQANSNLHLQILARKLLGIHPLQQLTFSSPPTISCNGTITLDEDHHPSIQLTGHAKINNFTYLGTHFNQLETEISLQGQNAYFTELRASHTEGEIKGRVLIKDGTIRYEAQSSLPASAYKPFILSPIAKKHIEFATFSPSSRIVLTSQGLINQNTSGDWSFEGHGKLQNFTYKGVPMKEVKAHYQTNPKNTTFTKVALTFDYHDYALRKKYGGPLSARVDSDEVRIDHKKRMVHIKNVHTTAWPAPVVRLFATKAADHCERYKFFRPPTLIGHGSFDMNKDQARTDFKIDVRVPSSTHYNFLGETLTLRRLRGNVRIRQQRVDVNNLSFHTFQGPCSGRLTVQTKKRLYEGTLQWSRLHLKDLGQVYHFKKSERGLITGRIEFNGQSNAIDKFNGKGGIALERGNLFSIPMLGPLTPLIGGLLGKKNPTNEQAENASCTYGIRNGIVYSDNFLANTRSLRFTGEGNINLKNKEIDIMVRMNARGLFSLFALPLRPFMGLFQFKGTGNLSEPVWKTSLFTAPKRGKKDPIFHRPPKARVINE